MSGPAVISIGELLVEFVSHDKGCRLRRIGEYSGPYPSGAPAIFADQVARCGVRSSLFGAVGRDGFGASLMQRLTEDGVDTAGVRERGDLTTGVAFVSYNDDGTRQFIFHLTDTAADSVEFTAGDLPEGDLILHVSGASLGDPRLRAAIMTAVDAVAARSGRISVDPNARPELMRDPAARQALDAVMARASILLPSTSDLAFLFPDLAEDDAVDRLISGGAGIVALKRGAAGAAVIANGARHEVAPHRVTEIDPTGAGDCFCGAFVACLAQGRPVAEALRIANAAGALAVTRRGPMEGNADLPEIQRFLDREDAAVAARRA